MSLYLSFQSVPFIYVSVSLCLCSKVLTVIATESYEMRQTDCSHFSFSNSFAFLYKFYHYFVSIEQKKNLAGVLVGIVLNLYINWENLPFYYVYEHNMSLPLFVSLISFISTMKLSPWKFYTCLVRFIAISFYLNDDKSHCFSLTFMCSLLTYRNTNVFCMLILYPATFLNFIINSRCRFFQILYLILLSANWGNFISSF